MMSMDIAAIGAASPPPDASSASTATPEGVTGFAALLDEAAGTDGESLDPSCVTDEGDADDEEALAALAITSLLSLSAPVETPVEAVEMDLAGTGEIGDEAAIAGMTTPDRLIDVSAQGDGDQAAANIEADSEGTATSPVWNAEVRTTAKRDVTADNAASVSESPVKGESTVTGGDAATETRGEAETPTSVNAHPAQPPQSGRGNTPSRTDHTRPVQAIDVNNQPATAQTNAAVANHAAADATQVTGRKDTTDAPPPSSTAARLARALERAAALTNESGAAAAVAATDGGSGQPSSFGDPSAERDTHSFEVPRQASGGVTFTVAAPTPFDIRTLARAVDAASHATDASAPQIPERDVVAQLVQSMRVQFRDGIGEAVVKLKPDHLGAVQVSLKIENGAITATVQAEVASVRHWLESQQDTLRTSLAEQGLRLERFVVEPDGERQAARDDAQPREQRRQQQRRRERAAMSGTDQPVFDVTV
jgi:flagellar hook-length control protein FliK